MQLLRGPESSPQNLGLDKKVAARYIERQSAKFALAKLQTCFNADPKDHETITMSSNVTRTIPVLLHLTRWLRHR